MASFALAGPFYREHNEDSPKRLSEGITCAIFSKLRMVAGPIPETIKVDQDSYPLQNPLHWLSLSGIPLSEKGRNPRQVNKKEW
jgi:hypothetical protein